MFFAAMLIGCLCVSAPESCPRRPVPLYTDEDLERVHPYRGETGVLSVPAVAPAQPAPAGAARRKRAESKDEETEEAYWRGESARHRLRMARLSRSAAGLRRQLEERQRRQREAGQRGRSVGSVASLKDRLNDIEMEMQAVEAEFEERSRRAGALPGWLR